MKFVNVIQNHACIVILKLYFRTLIIQQSRSAGVSLDSLFTCAAYGGRIRKPRDVQGCLSEGWIGFWPLVGRTGGDTSTPVNLLFIHVTHCFRGASRLVPTSGT